MSRAIPINTANSPYFKAKEIEQRLVLNFVSIQTNSNKYYIIEFQRGTGSYEFRIYTEYGRMGRTPRREGRYFDSREEAQGHFQKLLLSKQKKGYKQIVIEEDWDFFSPIPNREKFRPVHSSGSLSLHTQLGELSEMQLHRGLQVLEKLELHLKNGLSNPTDLTNQFYSLVPMTFGNQIDQDSVLDTVDKVVAKKEWILEKLSFLNESAHY